MSEAIKRRSVLHELKSVVVSHNSPENRCDKARNTSRCRPKTSSSPCRGTSRSKSAVSSMCRPPGAATGTRVAHDLQEIEIVGLDVPHVILDRLRPGNGIRPKVIPEADRQTVGLLAL